MDNTDFEFDFEKLRVYRKSLKFTKLVYETTFKFKREIQFSLGDQFRRAALSICNNLAEGNQKTEKGRNQFYKYSLDSSRECIPMIDLAKELDQISANEREYLRSECIHIANMLCRLKQSLKTNF